MFLVTGNLSNFAVAATDPSFQAWLNDFYPQAAKQGISKKLYQQVFAGVTAPDQEVLRKAAYQPEFTTKIWDYLDTAVNAAAVAEGRVMAKKHKIWLDKVAARFGVEGPVLLAIWSIESRYGAVLDKPERLHYVPLALATLAYGDKNRKEFARQQLLAALQMVKEGDVGRAQLYGSWAGAMGHTQFIPTSYQLYGVDMDKDGQRDIWNSVPDALATAANLLHKNGWQTGKAWGYEVQVPKGGVRYKGKTKTLVQWKKLGFTRPNGGSFPEPGTRAELKMLAGDQGPGFLCQRNFFIIKRYNASDFYALAVSLLSDRLAGKAGMIQTWPRPADALFAEEKFKLQELLQGQGVYDGAIDGDLGSGTRKGIKVFQSRIGMTPDGEPTRAVFEALRKAGGK
ncbi:lytic murein transglycosylase [Candidatus Electrothrix sp.]|uniref:lytic murein transglycosylase n=1 Tax=Candidatus Electrothrix sp. TaxID=2170559 RepID=UPI0040572CE7